MYQIFLGEMPLPLAPARITTTIGNRSETVELINGDEVNLLKGAKLQEFNFEFMVPAKNYPFLKGGVGSIAGGILGSAMGAVASTAILAYLEDKKQSMEPFQFICVRLNDSMQVMGAYDTNIKVTLEDYTITEDADNGGDFMVDIHLKEYKDLSITHYDAQGVARTSRA